MTTAVSRITPCPPGFSDHIYKDIHGVSLPLRIWAAPGTTRKAPWLLWIHGGGFIAGKHVIPNAWVIPAFHAYGFHVVSIAYRFLPHVQLPEIIQDCQDAYAWCRLHLPRILGEGAVDLSAVVVGGDSAGGTMSTLLGHLMRPPPRVVLDVYGGVDPADPCWYEGVPRGEWVPYLRPREDGEMRRALEERDPSKAEYICPWDWELEPCMTQGELRSFWGCPDFTVTDAHYFRMDLSKYLWQTGGRMQLLYQRWLYSSHEAFLDGAKKLGALPLLEGRRAGEYPYPPTFILHGTGDKAVPVEQSYRFAKRLKELDVPVGERYAPDAPHCFENKIEGPGQAGWDEYIVPCMEFIKAHISRAE